MTAMATVLRDLTLDDDLDGNNGGNPRWPGATFLRERGERMSDSDMTMVGAEVAGRTAAFLYSTRAILSANDRLGFERLDAYVDVAIDVR